MSNVMISANYLRELCKWFKQKWIAYSSQSVSFGGLAIMDYASTSQVVSIGELLAFLYYISNKVCKNDTYTDTTKDDLIDLHQELLVDLDLILNKVKEVLGNCFTTVTTQVSPKGTGTIFVNLYQGLSSYLIPNNTHIGIKAVKGINYTAYQVPTPGYLLNTSNITGTSESNATTFNTSTNTLLTANYTPNYLATDDNYFYYVNTIPDAMQIQLFGNSLSMRGNTSRTSAFGFVTYSNSLGTSSSGNTVSNLDATGNLIPAYPCVKSNDPKGHTYTLCENYVCSNNGLPGYQYLQKVVINTNNGLEAGNYVNMPELTDVYINSGTSPCLNWWDLYFPLDAFYDNPNLVNMYINLDHPLCLRANSLGEFNDSPFEGNNSNFTIWVKALTIPFYLNDSLMENPGGAGPNSYTGWISSGASTYISSAYKYRVTLPTSSGGLTTVTTLPTSLLRSNTPHTICILNSGTNLFWLADITSTSCTSRSEVGISSGSPITLLNNLHIIYSDYPLTNLGLTLLNQRYTLSVASAYTSYRPYIYVNSSIYTTDLLFYEGTPISIRIVRPGYTSSFDIYGSDNSLQELISGNSTADFIINESMQIRNVSLTLTNYSVKVTSDNGSVTFKVNGVDTPATLTGNVYILNNVHMGDSVQMTVTPNTNYSFDHWDDGTSTASKTITIGEANEIFIATCTSTLVTMYTVEVTNDGHGTAVITKVNESVITETTLILVTPGSKVTIKSKTANSGYSFDKWSDGIYIDERTIRITSDITIKAMFDLGISPSPASYERADFLKSLAASIDGGGFIDTLLPMTNSAVYNAYRHEFKLRFDTTSAATQGAIWNSNGGTFGVLYRINNNNSINNIALKRSLDGPNSNGLLTKTISHDNEWHIYDLTNPTTIKIDGSSATSTSGILINTTSNVPQGNFILFGRVCYPWSGTSFITKQYPNYTGYYNTYKMSIAYYKIYNSSGTPLHYFIPAKFIGQGGIYGMWDRISGRFFSATNNMTDWLLGTF